MRLYSFGNIILPQLQAQHQLPVPFRSNTVDLRNGAFDMDGANTYLERKILSATFWVSSQDVSDIDQFLDDIYTEAYSGRQILTAKMRDDSLRQAQVKLVQGITKPRANVYVPDSISDLEGYEPMNVSFEMVYPYWRQVAETFLSYTGGEWVWSSGYGWDSGNEINHILISGTTSTLNCFNAGIPHKDLTITINPGTGESCTDILIRNATTSTEVTYTGTVAANEVLTLKGLPQHIDLDGTGVYENLDVPDTQIHWWDFVNGTNQFQISATSVTGNPDISIKWQTHYVR